jgi:hypothetical protein
LYYDTLQELMKNTITKNKRKKSRYLYGFFACSLARKLW